MQQTVLVRRGDTHLVCAVLAEDNGSRLLRTVGVAKRVLHYTPPAEPLPLPVEVCDEVVAPPVSRPVRVAKPRPVDPGSRMSSCWGYGLRSHAQFEHGYETRRWNRWCAESTSARRRGEALGLERRIGKHACWKDVRSDQHRPHSQ